MQLFYVLACLVAAKAATDPFGPPEASLCPHFPTWDASTGKETPDAEEAIWSENPPPPTDATSPADPKKPQGWDWDEDVKPDGDWPPPLGSWNWDEDAKPEPDADEAVWSENPPPPDAAVDKASDPFVWPAPIGSWEWDEDFNGESPSDNGWHWEEDAKPDSDVADKEAGADLAAAGLWRPSPYPTETVLTKDTSPDKADGVAGIEIGEPIFKPTDGAEDADADKTGLAAINLGGEEPLWIDTDADKTGLAAINLGIEEPLWTDNPDADVGGNEPLWDPTSDPKLDAEGTEPLFEDMWPDLGDRPGVEAIKPTNDGVDADVGGNEPLWDPTSPELDAGGTEPLFEDSWPKAGDKPADKANPNDSPGPFAPPPDKANPNDSPGPFAPPPPSSEDIIFSDGPPKDGIELDAKADNTIRDMIIRRGLRGLDPQEEKKRREFWEDCDVLGPPPFVYHKKKTCDEQWKANAPDHMGTICLKEYFPTDEEYNKMYVCNTRKECWTCWKGRPTKANPKDPSKPIVAKRGCPTICPRHAFPTKGVLPPVTTQWHCYRGDHRVLEDYAEKDPFKTDPPKPDPSKP